MNADHCDIHKKIAIQTPTCWHKLPNSVRSAESLAVFKNHFEDIPLLLIHLICSSQALPHSFSQKQRHLLCTYFCHRAPATLSHCKSVEVLHDLWLVPHLYISWIKVAAKYMLMLSAFFFKYLTWFSLKLARMIPVTF